MEESERSGGLPLGTQGCRISSFQYMRQTSHLFDCTFLLKSPLKDLGDLDLLHNLQSERLLFFAEDVQWDCCGMK